MSVTHSWQAYSNGCRCQTCRDAWRLYHADYVARRKSGEPDVGTNAEQGRRAARARWGVARSRGAIR